jgi:hypothetical protein
MRRAPCYLCERMPAPTVREVPNGGYVRGVHDAIVLADGSGRRHAARSASTRMHTYASAPPVRTSAIAADRMGPLARRHSPAGRATSLLRLPPARCSIRHRLASVCLLASADQCAVNDTPSAVKRASTMAASSWGTGSSEGASGPSPPRLRVAAAEESAVRCRHQAPPRPAPQDRQ